MSRAAALALALSAASGLALLSAACEPELGDVPATCPNGTCPEGYECIHGVCARPGTSIPITVEATDFLRANDLIVVPQEGSVLVLWETYAYSTEGQSIRARRLFADGSVSEPMVLEDTWVAAEAGLEPFFDVLSVSDTSALLALTSGTIDDAPEPRLRVFHVSLPASGEEALGVVTVPAWEDEVRMPTLGYGGVSRPHFVRRDDSRISLGYFQSRAIPSDVPSEGGGGAAGGGGAGQGGGAEGGAGGGLPDAGVTLGELAVFELDAQGEVVVASQPCGPDETCCVASACTQARADRTLAVGVVGGYATESAMTWVLDDERPSVLVVPDAAPEPLEAPLPNLCVPVGVIPGSAGEEGLLVLVPSERTGEKLPTDPVEGPAIVQLRTLSGSEDLVELPIMHDSPRPATLLASPESLLVATPGRSADAATLLVYRVDLSARTYDLLAEIPRLSSQTVGVVRIVAAAGKLFVVWLDEGDETVTIRAAILDGL